VLNLPVGRYAVLAKWKIRGQSFAWTWSKEPFVLFAERASTRTSNVGPINQAVGLQL
jgi:hypothetical protein